MRVLLHQPCPVQAVLLLHGFRFLALALPQRQLLQCAPCDAFSVRLQVVERVRPWRQNEYDRSLFGRRLVAFGNVEERRFSEEFAHDFDDVVLDRFVDLVGPDCLVHQQLLEWIEIDVPLARERDRFRVFSVVDGLELLSVGHELLLEAVEPAQVLQAVDRFVHLAPGQTVHECRRFRDVHILHEAHQQLLEVVSVHFLLEYLQLHD